MKKTPNILAHHQQVPFEMMPEETVQIIWLVCFNLLEKTAHITYCLLILQFNDVKPFVDVITSQFSIETHARHLFCSQNLVILY